MKNSRKISDVTETYWINVKRICGSVGLLWAEHIRLAWAEHALRKSIDAQCYHLKNALKEKNK